MPDWPPRGAEHADAGRRGEVVDAPLGALVVVGGARLARPEGGAHLGQVAQDDAVDQLAAGLHVDEAALRQVARVGRVRGAVPVDQVAVVEVGRALRIVAAEHHVVPGLDDEALVADDEGAVGLAVVAGERDPQARERDRLLGGVEELDPLAVRAALVLAELGQNQLAGLYLGTAGVERRPHACGHRREHWRRRQAQKTVRTAREHGSRKSWYTRSPASGPRLQEKLGDDVATFSRHAGDADADVAAVTIWGAR
ncbi:hypothetical protein [Nannocystis pusilla]|uniref:hypothetical protein n=1 Tax=Nannocystis pusilla TaxID=889268 RepID=UPI003B7A8C4A